MPRNGDAKSPREGERFALRSLIYRRQAGVTGMDNGPSIPSVF